MDGDFGTSDDGPIVGGATGIVSRIASVMIKGGVVAVGGMGGDFGIVARMVDKVKVGPTLLALTNNQDNILVSGTDLHVREIGIMVSYHGSRWWKPTSVSTDSETRGRLNKSCSRASNNCTFHIGGSGRIR